MKIYQNSINLGPETISLCTLLVIFTYGKLILFAYSNYRIKDIQQ